MIDFLLRAVGLLAILFVAMAIGNASALATIREEAPELFDRWRAIHDERRGKR